MEKAPDKGNPWFNRNLVLGVLSFIMAGHFFYTTGEPPVMAGVVTLYFGFKFYMGTRATIAAKDE